MNMYFVVRSVNLTRTGNTAVTLEPVEWGRESTTETETVGGEVIPKWEPCDPSIEGAEPYEPGGKMTELRFDSDPGWRPGDHVVLEASLVDSWNVIEPGASALLR